MFNLGAAKRKSGQVILLVEDLSSGDRAKLDFDSWEEAHNHVRQVILGQVIEELAEIALQDDPTKWKEEIDTLSEIGKYVNYPRDEEELKYAVEAWKEYTDGHSGYTVVEIL